MVGKSVDTFAHALDCIVMLKIFIGDVDDIIFAVDLLKADNFKASIDIEPKVPVGLR